MKATVKYNNVFVTSAYDIETLKKVKKFRPEALVLYKGEGKEKEPVCAIGVSRNASANAMGVTFAKDSVTSPKVATMSIELPAGLTDATKINAWVRDILGLAIVNCNKIEDQIAAAMTEINADEAAMNAAITIEDDAAQPEHSADAE